jgi:hypothetical protein
MGKRSIDFTKERTEKLTRIAHLMGINGTYGEIPKTIDFCVTCTEKYLELMAQVTPSINRAELTFFFNSVANCQKEAKKPSSDIETGERPRL